MDLRVSSAVSISAFLSFAFSGVMAICVSWMVNQICKGNMIHLFGKIENVNIHLRD